jgi:hypothetical protein
LRLTIEPAAVTPEDDPKMIAGTLGDPVTTLCVIMIGPL